MAPALTVGDNSGPRSQSRDQSFFQRRHACGNEVDKHCRGLDNISIENVAVNDLDLLSGRVSMRFPPADRLVDKTDGRTGCACFLRLC